MVFVFSCRLFCFYGFQTNIVHGERHSGSAPNPEKDVGTYSLTGIEFTTETCPFAGLGGARYVMDRSVGQSDSDIGTLRKRLFCCKDTV